MAQVEGINEPVNKTIVQFPTEENNETENASFDNNHLIKIDFPLVTQEYKEIGKHYLTTLSERMLDPNGYVNMKTKVEHYLYRINIKNDIGKPIISDIVRFPQEILNSYKSKDLEETTIEPSVSSSPVNHFEKLEIKSNFKLVSKLEKRTKRGSKRFKPDNDLDDESSSINCICNEDDEVFQKELNCNCPDDDERYCDCPDDDEHYCDCPDDDCAYTDEEDSDISNYSFK